jgi:crossover junction endodeoxyribonuclease RusA
MTPAATFTVPGNPVPWERSRSRGGQHFTAPRSKAFKTLVQAYAREARVPRAVGPVMLSVTFYRKTRQRCDLDNLVKAIQDALNGIAYGDDAQIVSLVAVKAVSPDDPRTEVEIATVEELLTTEAA